MVGNGHGVGSLILFVWKLMEFLPLTFLAGGGVHIDLWLLLDSQLLMDGLSGGTSIAGSSCSLDNGSDGPVGCMPAL